MGLSERCSLLSIVFTLSTLPQSLLLCNVPGTCSSHRHTYTSCKCVVGAVPETPFQWTRKNLGVFPFLDPENLNGILSPNLYYSSSPFQLWLSLFALLFCYG
jgi:hypothetical protein